jgi:hypothetical protein
VNRFERSNRTAREAVIDSRRPGLVKGAVLPVSRASLVTLFSTPER